MQSHSSNPKIKLVPVRDIYDKEAVIAVEAEQAHLNKQMKGYHFDAWSEIAEAFQLQNQGLLYATQDLTKTSKAHDPDSDYTEHQQELLDNLAKLKKKTSWRYGPAIDVIALCHSVKDVSEKRNMIYQEVCHFVINVMDEWSRMRGWIN